MGCFWEALGIKIILHFPCFDRAWLSKPSFTQSHPLTGTAESMRHMDPHPKLHHGHREHGEIPDMDETLLVGGECITELYFKIFQHNPD